MALYIFKTRNGDLTSQNTIELADATAARSEAKAQAIRLFAASSSEARLARDWSIEVASSAGETIYRIYSDPAKHNQ